MAPKSPAEKRPAGKIFCIGLSKTGTSSLEEALRVLGFSVLAFPPTVKDVARHEVASDITVALNFAYLDRRFPGSRFIYSQRALPGWLESCQAMWARRQGFYDANPFMTQVHQALYGSTRFEADLFSAAYWRHDGAVKSHFSDRPGDLLDLDLARTPDPWAPICAFVGKAKPGVPFPQANTSGDIALLVARIAAVLGITPQTAALLNLEEATFHDLVKKGQAQEATRLAPGWEIDLMLSPAAHALEARGENPAVALGLDEAWFALWVQRSGFGAKTKLLPWLKHGLAARFGIELGPKSPFFDDASGGGDSGP